MILVIRARATIEQLNEMLVADEILIRVVVDIERGILAGGGETHSDAEQDLLADGSAQRNLWGAGFMPLAQGIVYDSLINIRSPQNRSMEILDPTIRDRVAQIIMDLLGDV